MHVIDMHCDSLLTVCGERGLISTYNVSKKHPFLQFFAAFVPKEGRPPDIRRRELMHLAEIYVSETARLGLSPARDAKELSRALENGFSGAMLTVEGGGGLFADSTELDTLAALGMRVMGLVWDTNELGASAWDKSDTGLTSEGYLMVERLSELGIIIDVSHMSDKTLYDTLDATSYPVVATHSNFRDVATSRRNLTLDMAKRIASRGGVVGLNLYPSFLSDGEADLSDVLRHVDYALNKLGEDTLAFGFDIDGTDGKYPAGIDESGSIHDRVVELLLTHYPERIVEKLAWRNAAEFLSANL
ncbi:MAG: dipeptidase [Clostridia bacterium]|nr:dipeptidase [Clostridia bacterium]